MWTMRYYEVLVADNSFKGAGALTYTHERGLPVGTVVAVPVKQRRVMGVISREVVRPRFACKPLVPTDAITPIPSELINLAGWMMQYYPASAGETMQQFLPGRIYPPAEPEPATDPDDTGLPPLTDEQRRAVEAVEAGGADTYLLHGETGSGKTRAYIELALRAWRRGRSSIVLTPEIGLTPQLTEAFESVFGNANVITTHSRLTAKERALQWHRALARPAGRPLLVLGPRSALFLPLRDLGLIVLDESHEASYKQEQAPHYHAAKVAAKLSGLHGAALVLGSATPPVGDYFVARAKDKQILRLTAAARQHDFEPPVTAIIDLKDRSKFSRKPHLSDDLLKSVEASLRAGEQSLVFLNRRGTARTVVCELCGWVATCSHCDLPLTYHGDAHDLRCHTCGLVQRAFISCPECGSPQIMMKSVGTKAIVDELQSAFPQAIIQRFDTDNKKSERLEAHYHNVRDGKVDIVVGTQLVAKGLDLPGLSTVGVVVADTSLYLPDYTATERTYQLLRQVIGRVGRGHRAGRVVLQTYDPASPIIRAAATGDWEGFYDAEIRERQQYHFPPFVHTLKLAVRRASPSAAEKAAQKVADALQDSGLHLTVDGPMPALHEKHGDKYQWQLVCKASERSQLVAAIHALPANWSYDIDPTNLL